MLWVPLEASHRDASNEHPQHVSVEKHERYQQFSVQKKKKNIEFSRAVQLIVCWVLVGLWVKMGFGLKDFYLKSKP